MMKLQMCRMAICVGILGFVARGVSGPPEYELSRSTIDGVGVMRSTSGDFELSGTIGQPSVGVMTSGSFELSSGFLV